MINTKVIHNFCPTSIFSCIVQIFSYASIKQYSDTNYNTSISFYYNQYKNFHIGSKGEDEIFGFNCDI
ncbi:hypothetical protein X975_01389, partial [Stegodyphus mimosarum]